VEISLNLPVGCSRRTKVGERNVSLTTCGSLQKCTASVTVGDKNVLIRFQGQRSRSQQTPCTSREETYQLTVRHWRHLVCFYCCIICTCAVCETYLH